MKVVIDMIRGFCMAMADSVPGVSGGTIAFLMGFYDKFINSLNDLISGKKAEKIEALKFLAKLGVGWVVGFVSCVLILTKLFDTYIYEISSLFIGLTLFAIPVVFMEEKRVLKESIGVHFCNSWCSTCILHYIFQPDKWWRKWYKLRTAELSAWNKLVLCSNDSNYCNGSSRNFRFNTSLDFWILFTYH